MGLSLLPAEMAMFLSTWSSVADEEDDRLLPIYGAPRRKTTNYFVFPETNISPESSTHEDCTPTDSLDAPDFAFPAAEDQGDVFADPSSNCKAETNFTRISPLNRGDTEDESESESEQSECEESSSGESDSESDEDDEDEDKDYSECLDTDAESEFSDGRGLEDPDLDGLAETKLDGLDDWGSDIDDLSEEDEVIFLGSYKRRLSSSSEPPTPNIVKKNAKVTIYSSSDSEQEESGFGSQNVTEDCVDLDSDAVGTSSSVPATPCGKVQLPTDYSRHIMNKTPPITGHGPYNWPWTQ